MRQFVRSSLKRGTVHEIREQFAVYELERWAAYYCEHYGEDEPYWCDEPLDGNEDGQSEHWKRLSEEHIHPDPTSTFVVVREGRCNSFECRDYGAERLELRRDGSIRLHSMMCYDSFESGYGKACELTQEQAAVRLGERLQDLRNRIESLECERRMARQAMAALGAKAQEDLYRHPLTAKVIRLPLRAVARLRRKAS